MRKTEQRKPNEGARRFIVGGGACDGRVCILGLARVTYGYNERIGKIRETHRLRNEPAACSQSPETDWISIGACFQLSGCASEFGARCSITSMARHLSERIRGKYRRTISKWFVRKAVRFRNPVSTISFAFDDFPVSAVTEGAAVLEAAGFVGSFYASFGLRGSVGPVGRYFDVAEIKSLCANGHEVGCHTFHHLHAWVTKPRIYEESVQRNLEALGCLLSGSRVATHAYPIGDPNPGVKNVAARYFRCARGNGVAANCTDADANNLSSYFLEKAGGNFDLIKGLIDNAVTSGKWLILSTHDISESPSAFGCTPAFFQSVVSYSRSLGVSVMPVAEAYELRNPEVL